MDRVFSLFLFALAMPFATQAQQANQPMRPLDGTAWIMTFEDNFNGTTLDTTKWTARKPTASSQRYRPDFVSVSNGNLVLKIDRDSTSPNGYRAAAVDTTKGLGNMDNKFDQLYGFFEARAMVPPTNQTLFAFWMHNWPGMGNVDGTGRDGTEIDVVESAYRSDLTQSTLHIDGYGADHKVITNGPQPATNIHVGYHVYGVEWDRDNLKFYYDGKLTWHYQGVAVPWVKEFMLLSTEALIGFGEGNISQAQLPYYAHVDYVRVWKKGTSTSSGGSTGGSTTADGQTFKPTDDSYVRDGIYSGNNFGSETTMMVKSDVANNSRQAFLKFNFAGYKGSVPAKQIKLRLFVSNVNIDPIRTIKVYGTYENWSQSTINSNNDPAITTFLGSFNVTNSMAGKWVELDVTNSVNSQMGDKIISFKLVNEGGASLTNNVSFNAKEASSNQPELVIISNPLTFIASADAYVRKGIYANNNYGGEALLTVKSSANQPNDSYKSYLRFNYTTYSAPSISSAKLKLTVSSVGTDASRTLRVYGVKNESWSELGINWSNAPLDATYLGSITVSSAAGASYQFDVTNYIKQHTDKIVSFAITNEGVTTLQNIVSFHSKNSSSSSKPQLILAP
ncbi:MAG: DNRLRE domain-containing protein [Pseudobdellovibrionaceae bacterium]